MSAVSFIVGIGVSSPSYGPFFLLGGIAIPAVAIFGYANFLQAGPIAFYRFAASALGVLVFTVSHLVIWPGYSPLPRQLLPRRALSLKTPISFRHSSSKMALGGEARYRCRARSDLVV